jgi:hypothetical protein
MDMKNDTNNLCATFATSVLCGKNQQLSKSNFFSDIRNRFKAKETEAVR